MALGEGRDALGRPSRDDDVGERRDGGPDRAELRLRLPTGPDEAEGGRTRPGEVLRGHAAGGACSYLAQPVGRDRRDERPVAQVEEADDEREAPLDDRVALEPGDAEPAVGGRHHREVPALDGEAPARHQLDLAGGHPPEAILDQLSRAPMSGAILHSAG